MASLVPTMLGRLLDAGCRAEHTDLRVVLVGPDGRLDVRYRGEEQLLPERDELPLLWRNPYFLDSLRQITWQLEDEL